MQNWTWNDYIQPLLDPAVWTGYTDMRSLITATYGSEVHSFLEDTSSYYAVICCFSALFTVKVQVSVTDMSPFALYDLFQQVELRGDRRPIDGMSQLTNSLLADSISVCVVVLLLFILGLSEVLECSSLSPLSSLMWCVFACVSLQRVQMASSAGNVYTVQTSRFVVQPQRVIVAVPPLALQVFFVICSRCDVL